MNWGSIPDWVAAIGTIGTLVVALWIIKDDRDRRTTEELSKSARHLSAWSKVERKEAPEKYTLFAKNTGEDPAYDCMMFSDLPVLAEPTPPGGDRFKEESGGFVRFFGVLAPGETFKLEFPNKEVVYEYQGLPDVWLEFTDASGKFWLRDRNGKLKPITKRTDRD